MNRLKKFILTALTLTTVLYMTAQTGTWSGRIKVQGMEMRLVFHLDGDKPALDSPDQGIKGIPIELVASETGLISVKIPSIGAGYDGVWMGGQIVGTFRQMGAELPLTLKPGVEKLNRPQTPQGPFAYDQEDVSFANGDAVLKGTLTLPENYTRSTPVVLMVTGSGLQNRDEEMFEHKPFAVIADALARAGIATLRYDDRGFGQSTGDIVNCTTDDLRDDALAGLRLLRQRFDHVGVLGHSEGGSIALMLAADGQCDFIVSLAGAVVSGKEILLWQNRLGLADAGVPEDAIEQYCAKLADAFDACIDGRNPDTEGADTLPDGLRQNFMAVVSALQKPYLRHLVAMDMRPLLGRIGCPVLSLNGTKDKQVDYESNLNALKTGLPTNKATRIESIEGVNHLFQHCVTGMPAEYKDIEETFAPEVITIISDWINSLK